MLGKEKCVRVNGQRKEESGKDVLEKRRARSGL